MTPQPGSSLTFINHASFLITTERINLLIDPWVEGTSFNTGWSLLDDSKGLSRCPRFFPHLAFEQRRTRRGARAGVLREA